MNYYEKMQSLPPEKIFSLNLKIGDKYFVLIGVSNSRGQITTTARVMEHIINVPGIREYINLEHLAADKYFQVKSKRYGFARNLALRAFPATKKRGTFASLLPLPKSELLFRLRFYKSYTYVKREILGPRVYSQLLEMARSELSVRQLLLSWTLRFHIGFHETPEWLLSETPYFWLYLPFTVVTPSFRSPRVWRNVRHFTFPLAYGLKVSTQEVADFWKKVDREYTLPIYDFIRVHKFNRRIKIKLKYRSQVYFLVTQLILVRGWLRPNKIPSGLHYLAYEFCARFLFPTKELESDWVKKYRLSYTKVDEIERFLTRTIEENIGFVIENLRKVPDFKLGLRYIVDQIYHGQRLTPRTGAKLADLLLNV